MAVNGRSGPTNDLNSAAERRFKQHLRHLKNQDELEELWGCSGCCQSLRPRYKRLVDNIYPVNPENGLDKSNMDKLNFFVLKAPEKLEKVGEYLAYKILRHLDRPKLKFSNASIGIEAMNILMKNCRAQASSSFLDNYFRVVQKLLETGEPDLQILATDSFVNFSLIEEECPLYHRYDGFISKFSTMCYCTLSTPDMRNRIRISGLKGLHGVIRRTAAEDVWEESEVEKIVPALLVNICEGMDAIQKDQDHPAEVAERVFRDLVCRTSYGNIGTVIRPMLTFLDKNGLWVSSKFPKYCFNIVMDSLQAQYGYLIVQLLMTYLDDNSTQPAKIRSGIIEILSQTVITVAGGSIGPSVLEVFNTLLQHLTISVTVEEEKKTVEERIFQESIVNTIGEFANELPDYQKIEILMFVIFKTPVKTEDPSDQQETHLQHILMKIILTVATKYQMIHIANAFPTAFLEPLLRLSLVENSGVRLIVQQIIQTLTDRHENLAQLNAVEIMTARNYEKIVIEPPPRQDIMFMRKNGTLFYWHIFENMSLESNRVVNFEAIYRTICLLAIELGSDSVIVELFRLILSIQQMGEQESLPITHKCAIHALVAAVMSLLGFMVGARTVQEYIKEVIDARNGIAKFVLPVMAFNRTNTADSYPVDWNLTEECMFNADKLAISLEENGYELPNTMVKITRPSIIDLNYSTTLAPSQSVSDINSANELEGIMGLTQRSSRPVSQDFRFDNMKKIGAFRSIREFESSPSSKSDKNEERNRIFQSFKTGEFEDIVAQTESRSTEYHNTLTDILDVVAKSEIEPEAGNQSDLQQISFSKLFVY